MNWDTEDWVMAIVAAIVSLFVLSFPVDCARAEHSIRYGTVIQCQYVPARTSTGVGTAVGSNGNVTVVPVVSSSPEKFVALVNIDGVAESADVPAELYVSLRPGDLVKIRTVRSLYFSSDLILEARK